MWKASRLASLRVIAAALPPTARNATRWRRSDIRNSRWHRRPPLTARPHLIRHYAHGASRKRGYSAALDDRAAGGATLAFLMSGGYNFSTLGGSADAHFLRSTRSCVGVGGTLSVRPNRACPGRPRDVVD